MWIGLSDPPYLSYLTGWRPYHLSYLGSILTTMDTSAMDLFQDDTTWSVQFDYGIVGIPSFTISGEKTAWPSGKVFFETMCDTVVKLAMNEWMPKTQHSWLHPSEVSPGNICVFGKRANACQKTEGVKVACRFCKGRICDQHRTSSGVQTHSFFTKRVRLASYFGF